MQVFSLDQFLPDSLGLDLCGWHSDGKVDSLPLVELSFDEVRPTGSPFSFEGLA